jgi:alcohol dehydrogenase class IV
VVATHAGVPHDPPLAAVDAVIALARQGEAEVIVAAGGGSVIDAAKAAAAVVPTGADGVGHFFHGEQTVTEPGLPLIALPTTAGSGAEITKNAVLTDRQASLKKSIRSPHMVPRGAIVDPDMTLTAPPSLTAASGLDALTQAIESYLSIRANAVTSALARTAVGLIAAHLPMAFRNGDNLAARTEVARGSLLSAMAFSQSGLGAVHGLAHPLGTALGLPHGLVCAILLPHVLAWNTPACQVKMAELGGTLGLGTAEDFARAITELCDALDVPKDFSEHGLHPDQFDFVIANCRSNSMRTTPRPMRDADVRSLLERLAAA